MKYITLLILALLPLSSSMAQSTAQTASEEVSPAATSSPKRPIKTVGILLYDGYTTLDAMGPYQVLSELMGTSVFFVAKQKGMVRNMTGMKVQVDRDFTDTDSLDMLVIPGGLQETYLTSKDPETLAWIRKIDQKSVYTTSVCTGAWILGATGLLTGKNATTHWFGKPGLRDMGVTVQDKRWVQDGKYWTSAGVTAGMDMSLALINDIRGEQYTKAAMLDLEYDPQPLFRAGSEQNTEKSIVDMIREMYNAGLAPAKKMPVPAPDQVGKSAKKPMPEPAVRPKKSARTINKPAASGLLADGIDPVCQMTVEKGTTITAQHAGHQYSFCSELCKERFKNDPAQYATKP